MDLVALQNGLDNISFAVLFVTMLIYWVGAAFPAIPYLSAFGTAGMAIANLCIAALLGARWLEAGYFPLSNLYESLFFLTWGITTVHLIAENMSRSRLVGVATAPVAMGITAFAALSLPSEMQLSEPLVPALKSNWLMMHVSVMMRSYAALMVGALLAIAFLVVTRGQNNELRGSSVGTCGFRIKDDEAVRPSYRLQRNGDNPPPQPQVTSDNSLTVASFAQNNGVGNTAVLDLVATSASSAPEVSLAKTLSPQRLSLADTLDNISYRIIGLGFPLLTIGIIAGAVWANEAWGSYWSWDPKETWAAITWLVYAGYLHMRITRGWRGRRAAYFAILGFAVVMFTFFGVTYLLPGLHAYA